MSHSDQILAKLQQIEDEMKRIGYWDDTLDQRRVRDEALAYAHEHGESPVAHMSFERWLQAVFIPNARNAARTDTLPSSSNVSVMAMRQYDYHSHVPEAQQLLHLLYEFDGLF